ncbi:Organic cation transporter protein [Gryllus bimaculatus]|nr:Organic cation transporter protein [Gryllus bimaculatus]
MVFDDVFPYLGDFGRYQKRIYFLLCLPGIPVAFHKLVNVFIQASASHRCRLPFEAENATYHLPAHILNLSYPRDPGGENKWSSCERLDTNFSAEYWDIGKPANSSQLCDEWVFDTSLYHSSAVTEWNLVCDRAWLKATADAIFMLGDLLGSLVFGDLSDRFGRKPIFFFSLVLQVVTGLLTALAPNYVSFMIARMIVGATTAGIFLVAYVIAMEMVGPSKRLVAGVIVQAFFTLGYILTAAFAYFIRDWRLLQGAVSLPGIVFFSYWWFVPESPRWLITKGRSDTARSVLHKAAKENRVTVPEDVLDSVTRSTHLQDPEKKALEGGSMLDLVRTPNLRQKSLVVFFIWFVNSCTYYGLSWNTSSLGGNDFINFCLSGFVEFPAYVILLFTLNRWGHVFWLTITLVMTGKMAITASFATIYVFSAELFPTVIRNVGIGASSTCARVGGMSAPYINLLINTWQPLPAIIFGAITVLAGLLALLLPETAHKTLPDSVAEGEEFGKKPYLVDMGYEDIFQYLGSYGPYQKRIHILLCLPSILVAFHRLVGVFLLAVPSHRCLLSCDCETGLYNLAPEIINMTIPWDSKDKEWSSCERLDTNFTFDYFETGIPASGKKKCESWVYDDTTYTSSIVTENNLVCDRKWLVPTGQSVFMLGDLLGSLVFGTLSDKYGRKITFILALTLQVVFGLMLAFLNDIISFLILRILIGMATAGVFNSSYVIGIELVGPKKRILAGVAVEFFWCIGYVILAGLAYCFRDWQTLQIITTVPGVIFLCLYQSRLVG